MQDCKSAIAAIEEAAKKNSNEQKTLTELEIGKGVRQGDVYLIRVSDEHTPGKETGNRQLAPGNTKGSRHIVKSKARIYEAKGTPAGSNIRREALLGPVVKTDGEPLVVDHPEHCTFELPEGTYQVVYQMDPRTQQRVLD